MKLSVVSTLYKSSSFIDEFYVRASSSAKNFAGNDYEIIFVDDGSPDNSLSKAIEFSKDDSNVTVIELSRNFGHHNAMLTGLRHAKGDLIFLVDVDLEEAPEWLADLNKAMSSNQADVVFGVQNRRKGGTFEKLTGALFYKFFRLLSGVNLPDNIMTCRLMSKTYVQALLSHEEKDIFLGGLMHVTGFKQVALPLQKTHKQSSSYTLRNRVSLLIKAVTSFSSKPLLYILYLGFLIFSSSLVLGIAILGKWITGGISIAGWVSLMLSVWALGGICIMSIGIVGIYVSKIFIEVKARPTAIIKQIHTNEMDHE